MLKGEELNKAINKVLPYYERFNLGLTKRQDVLLETIHAADELVQKQLIQIATLTDLRASCLAEYLRIESAKQCAATPLDPA